MKILRKNRNVLHFNQTCPVDDSSNSIHDEEVKIVENKYLGTVFHDKLKSNTNTDINTKKDSREAALIWSK